MFTKFGHRGAPGYPRHGENTLASFRKAIQQGAEALEFDVRKTKDGKIVVIHDATIDRTTNGSGRVCDLAYEELKKFDAGGDRIPLLEEILASFGGKYLMNIELKESGIAKEIKALILKRGLAASILVSAFDVDDNDLADDPATFSRWDELTFFHPEIQVALLAQKIKINAMGEAEYVESAVRLGAVAIHPENIALTQSLIDLAHSKGLKVHPYTVNAPEDISRFKAMGVDGIISDFPERL